MNHATGLRNILYWLSDSNQTYLHAENFHIFRNLRGGELKNMFFNKNSAVAPHWGTAIVSPVLRSRRTGLTH